MELLQIIALMCQVGSGGAPKYTQQLQLDCQQKYIHCVNTSSYSSPEGKLERCVLEKKL